MSDASAIYDWLVEVPVATSRNAEDVHAVASIVALAAEETKSGRAFPDGMGLRGAELRDLIALFFPHALELLEQWGPDAPVVISEDEGCLRELLARHATHRTRFQTQLAAIIAHRSMRPNHLWQDMGLRDRRELSALMARHFAPLAARNKGNMKWKKFFYRQICRDEGFRLCTSPTCSECDDFAGCFGDESGESLLARIRRDIELLVNIRPPLTP